MGNVNRDYNECTARVFLVKMLIELSGNRPSHGLDNSTTSFVPEGSILGPILFVCYVADLPSHIQTCSLSYADDVKIFHRIKCQRDVIALQADLNRLSDWSKKWNLKLNPAKCRAVTFSLRTSPIASSYFLDSHELVRCNEIRDLGVILDKRLTFGAHVDACVSKANRMLGLLMRSMHVSHCAQLPLFDHRAVIAAYNAHVRSVIEYASIIWRGAAPTNSPREARETAAPLSDVARSQNTRPLFNGLRLSFTAF